MDTQDPNGGHAFPGEIVGGLDPTSTDKPPGMSLRDWYAGLAMHGLLTCETMGIAPPKSELAALAWEYAQAMIDAYGP